MRTKHHYLSYISTELCAQEEKVSLSRRNRIKKLSIQNKGKMQIKYNVYMQGPLSVRAICAVLQEILIAVPIE